MKKNILFFGGARVLRAPPSCARAEETAFSSTNVTYNGVDLKSNEYYCELHSTKFCTVASTRVSKFSGVETNHNFVFGRRESG